MKNLIKVIVIAAFVLSTSSLIIAKDPPIKAKRITYEQSENNLFIGLNSDNLGLRISCAYMLGEIKSKNAVPELTSFIDKVDNDKARLTAILALLKIASSESNVVLNQNDSNIEISQLCERLINCHSCLTEIFDPQNVREEVSAVSE
jgi:hypothetical protein